MTALTSLTATLGQLATSANRAALDPRQYTGFTVRVGQEMGARGVLSGVLSQHDYDTFKDIVKDVNVNDASHEDMFRVYSRLIDAGLMTHEQAPMMFGSLDFDASGKGIHYDLKLDQWAYQKQQLPLYAGSEFDQTRGMAVETLQLVSAIANASPVTGRTVAAFAYAPQERPGAQASNTEVTVQLSELARRFAAGEQPDKAATSPDLALTDLIRQLEAAAKAQRIRQAGADEVA